MEKPPTGNLMLKKSVFSNRKAKNKKEDRVTMHKKYDYPMREIAKQVAK